LIIKTRKPDGTTFLYILHTFEKFRLRSLKVQELLYSQMRRVTLDVTYPNGKCPTQGGTMDSPPCIVIVEDESITALLLAKQLSRLGYQVVALANCGPQAIEHALAHRPHVVLMDIHLHGSMDGIDAAKHIQAAAPIPVVYMSAQTDAATLKRLQTTTQAAGFVPKPIHLPTLHATLQ
jgi:CheY-like chemotaxis protein